MNRCELLPGRPGTKRCVVPGTCEAERTGTHGVPYAAKVDLTVKGGYNILEYLTKKTHMSTEE